MCVYICECELTKNAHGSNGKKWRPAPLTMCGACACTAVCCVHMCMRVHMCACVLCVRVLNGEVAGSVHFDQK